MERKETLIIIFVVAILVVFSVWQDKPTDMTGAPTVAEPIGDALRRMTTKPFGLYVTPQDSPISPERFAGYHTGTDFEIFDTEQAVDVAVFAICSGPLRQKSVSSGYGGVLVQSCTLDGRPVTVIYGHVRLASVTASIGQELEAGKRIAVLGDEYSGDTDGERKHLHLGIHLGTAVNIRSYVPTRDALSAWLNIADYLQ